MKRVVDEREKAAPTAHTVTSDYGKARKFRLSRSVSKFGFLDAGHYRIVFGEVVV